VHSSVGSSGSTGGLVRRDLLFLGLTIVSASIDAISYLGLGRVFPANMTGNTVLLGIGMATGDAGAAARSATALGAFVLGAAAVGAATPGGPAARTFRTVLIGEVVMVAALCGWWVGVGIDLPDGALRYVLIAFAGVTMGAQSGLIGHLDVPVSTTYITGTWTAVSARTARRLRRRASGDPTAVAADASTVLQAIVVTGYLATAYVAALAFRHLGAVATMIPLGVLVLVTIATAIRPSVPGHRRRE
jgi:uncharacterized membrane protein YoaK (UPF0700 family)